MKKQKIFDFLNKVLYSNLFLWFFLIILKRFNLKPEINIIPFFFLSFLLFLGLFFRQILVFLILSLNKFNIYLKLTGKATDVKARNASDLWPLFVKQLLKFIKGSPFFLKFLLINRFFWLILAGFMIFLDIFVFKSNSNFLILFLGLLWFFSIYSSKIKIEITIGLSAILLIFCPFLLALNKGVVAEKAAIWVYMFLIMGASQIFISSLKEKNKNEEIKKK